MDNIDNLIRNLDWNKPEEVQKKAIEKLQGIDDSDLVHLAKQNDLNTKYCWHNAAIVLKSVGFLRIRSVIPFLMEWFQDVNWPGVNIIREIFLSVDSKELIPFIEEAAKRALLDHDDFWAFGLILLIRDIKVENLINEDIYEELNQLSAISEAEF